MNKKITVYLFNGSKKKGEWNGSETTEIKARLVQVVSRDRVRIYQGNGDVLSLRWQDGHIEHEGVYYEDMEIVS